MVELRPLLGVSRGCSQGVGQGRDLICGLGPLPGSHWFLEECVLL